MGRNTYCNKLWADARPWVNAGKLQLRQGAPEGDLAAIFGPR